MKAYLDCIGIMQLIDLYILSTVLKNHPLLCFGYFCECAILSRVSSLQSRVDEDCITELAVHYGKTKSEMKAMVEEVAVLFELE